MLLGIDLDYDCGYDLDYDYKAVFTPNYPEGSG
jgi:hypothetical protein